ncbi:hypothetical protein C8R47DRAFT_144518 [Mycena vitilis]|nr:hypothetical protein C8R47DRAFT_144518 [Mycena vitilis]
MSFISNVDQLSLGEGVYNNIQGNLNYNTVYNTFSCGRKRLQPDDRPDASGPATKRSRGGDALDRGLNVIPAEHLRLVLEIGSAPGYFVHAGEVAGRAVIVKVFNAGPTVREQLESTVALSQGLLHPNVLRLEGVSSPESLGHFLTYENAHWNSADGPMADALQCDLTRSIALGFKMVAGLSSGINYLSVQGISLGSLGMENFDIFLDVNDRFLISINPPIASNATRARPQNTTTTSWNILNSLCQKGRLCRRGCFFSVLNHFIATRFCGPLIAYCTTRISSELQWQLPALPADFPFPQNHCYQN